MHEGSCSFLIDWPRVNEGEWFCKDYNISLLLLNEPNPSSLVSLFNRVLVFLFSNTIRDHRMSKVQWTECQTTMDPECTVFILNNICNAQLLIRFVYIFFNARSYENFGFNVDVVYYRFHALYWEPPKRVFFFISRSFVHCIFS